MNGGSWNPSARLALVGILLLASSASAQTSKPAPAQPSSENATEDNPFARLQLGMTLEGFYEYNWNRPYDRINLLRAYDTRANVFGIQQTGVLLESPPDVSAGRRFGLRIDLQFGQATETVQGNPANEPRPESYRNLWQAYGTYIFPIGRGLQTDFGKFASSLGIETNYAKDNSQFSRAYLFDFLPFYHTGIRVTLPVNDSITVMYTLTNGIQETEDFNNFKSNHLSAVVKPVKAVTWTINYYFGQEQHDNGQPGGPDGFFRVFDTYATYALTPHVTLGADVNFVTDQVHKSDASVALQGTALYARYQLSGPAALAIRHERLDDEGLFAGIRQLLRELTATAEYRVAEGFLVRGEFRHDSSSEAFFTGARPDGPRTHQNTLLAGLVWWCGNKKGAW